VWPLYRYDPRRVERGEPPLTIDVAPGRVSVADYMRNETRFRMVEKIDPERFRRLAAAARDHAARRIALYEQLARIALPLPGAAQSAAAGQNQLAETAR
jgi:pyruvate-ferredoxin/flavodoxin oxidoreductase